MGEVKVEGADQGEGQIETIGLMMTGTPLEQIQRQAEATHG
jgi:hypothetical protein